jgi:hypothetical protein
MELSFQHMSTPAPLRKKVTLLKAMLLNDANIVMSEITNLKDEISENRNPSTVKSCS